MKVTLVDHTLDPEEKIGRFASVCYDSRYDRDSNIRRACNCVTKGHLATLRFAYATFLVDGISRACSHQLVRSKHLDYLQESQRYVNQKNAEFVNPEFKSAKLAEYYEQSYKAALQEYEFLLSKGVKKEDARYVLPNGSTTRLYITGNFQAWKDFINLRSGKEVQWELRNVAHSLVLELEKIAPNIFKEQADYARMVNQKTS